MLLFDLVAASAGERMEARREAGLLLHEHGRRAPAVAREKLVRRPGRVGRLTLWYLAKLMRARRGRKLLSDRRTHR